MSGAVSGVQKIMHDKTPYGFYVHCSAHRLNLCLVDACKVVPEAEDFFAVMERLYCFLSTSVVLSIRLNHLWATTIAPFNFGPSGTSSFNFGYLQTASFHFE